MHLKKAFRCAVWALVIVFVLSSTALAAIPNNTIIFKDKAYDLSLLNDAGMVNEILNAFVANNNSFIYKTPAGSLIDPNAAAVNANQLPAVTYKDANKVSTQYSAGDGPVVPQEVAVTAVTAINDINVANGTALANIGLPATVEVTKADSTKANLAVTWDGGTPAYSATTAGTYTFSGTITLPAGVTNPNSLKASVKVIVAAPVLTVSSVSAIDASNNTYAINAMPVTANIKVTFNFSLDTNTVLADNFQLAKSGVRIPATVTYDDTTKSVTVDPNTTLTENANYVLTVNNVKSTAATGAKTLAQAYTANITTGSQLLLIGKYADLNEDNNIIASENINANDVLSPAAGTDASAFEGNFKVIFNKAINTDTMSNSNVKLYNVTDSQYVALVLTADTTDSILINPAVNLAKDKKYKLILNQGITDLAGNALTGGTEIPFVVGTAPTFDNANNDDIRVGDILMASGGVDAVTVTSAAIKINPSKTVAAGSFPIMIQAQFTANLDSTTVNTTNIYLRKKDTTTNIPVDVTYNSSNFTITITPQSDLDQNTTYVATFTNNIMGAIGGKITQKTITFTTGDTVKPTVASVVPAAGSSTVSPTADIVITFSEAMAAVNGSNAYNANTNTLVLSNNTGGVKYGNNSGTIALKSESDNAWVDISGFTRALSTDAKTLTITPTAGALAAGKTYTLYVRNGSAGVKDAAKAADGTTPLGNTMTDEYAVTFTTAGDTVKPTVLSVKGTAWDTNVANTTAANANYAITNGTTDVDIDSNIVIEFNDNDVAPIAETTFGAATAVRLYDITAGLPGTANTTICFQLYDGNATPIKAGNTHDYIVVKAQANNLTNGSKYRLMLTSAITDTNNNAMDQVTYDFIAGQGPQLSMGGNTSPVEAATVAAGNLGNNLTVEFATMNNIELDPATVNTTTVKLYKVVSGVDNAVALTSVATAAGAATTSQIVIDPAANLEGSSTYKVWISKDVKDTNGNQVFQALGVGPADIAYMFSTADNVGPTVASTTVANNATGVDRIASIGVTFSEAIGRDSNGSSQAIPSDGSNVLQLGTYADYADNGTINAPVAVTVTVSADNKTVTVKPNAALNANTKYVLRIIGDNTNNTTGIADTSGNNLAADYILAFTTGSTATDNTPPAFVSVDDASPWAAALALSGDSTYHIANASIGSPLVFEMSETVDISNATVTMLNLSAANTPAVGLLPLVRENANGGINNGIKVVPTAARTQNNIYKVTISGVKDAAGNVAADIVKYFTQE